MKYKLRHTQIVKLCGLSLTPFLLQVLIYLFQYLFKIKLKIVSDSSNAERNHDEDCRRQGNMVD